MQTFKCVFLCKVFFFFFLICNILCVGDGVESPHDRTYLLRHSLFITEQLCSQNTVPTFLPPFPTLLKPASVDTESDWPSRDLLPGHGGPNQEVSGHAMFISETTITLLRWPQLLAVFRNQRARLGLNGFRCWGKYLATGDRSFIVILKRWDFISWWSSSSLLFDK